MDQYQASRRRPEPLRGRESAFSGPEPLAPPHSEGGGGCGAPCRPGRPRQPRTCCRRATATASVSHFEGDRKGDLCGESESSMWLELLVAMIRTPWLYLASYIPAAITLNSSPLEFKRRVMSRLPDGTITVLKVQKAVSAPLSRQGGPPPAASELPALRSWAPESPPRWTGSCAPSATSATGISTLSCVPSCFGACGGPACGGLMRGDWAVQDC